MTEIGFPQRRSAEVKNGNSGGRSPRRRPTHRISVRSTRSGVSSSSRSANGSVKSSSSTFRLQSAANRADTLTKPVSTKRCSSIETLCDVILNVRRTAVNLHAIVASKMPF